MKHFLLVLQKIGQKKNHSYSGSENPNFARAPDPNWELSELIFIKNWKLSESEIVRIGNCQWPPVAKSHGTLERGLTPENYSK